MLLPLPLLVHCVTSRTAKTTKMKFSFMRLLIVQFESGVRNYF
jgi:hypothetical protein